MGKIIERTDLPELVSEWKDAGYTVVSTCGCFDIFHAGHLKLLRKARELGDLLIVAVNSDISVYALKHREPLITLEERMQLLAALECVDHVVPFPERNAMGIIGEIKPHIHCKGSDYVLSEIFEKEIVERNGGTVTLIPISEGHSTTSIIQKILNVNGKIDTDSIASNVIVDDDHAWGRELRLVNNPLYCAKFLEYDTHQECGSDHYHEEKTESFKVLSGNVIIAREYRTGEEVIIPPKHRHFVGAITDSAVILEVSTHHEDSDTYRVAQWKQTPIEQI